LATKIFLIDNPVMIHDECLDPAEAVLGRVCHQGESVRHPIEDNVALAADKVAPLASNVTLLATWRVFPLRGENLKVVTIIGLRPAPIGTVPFLMGKVE